MNLESTPTFNSSSVGNTYAVPSADGPGFFYNGGHHMMQQPQQQQQQQQQQQYVLQDQLQLQEQLSYPAPSTSPHFRFGHGTLRGISSPALARALSTLSADKSRRPRGEKKPIPEEQKDDKYFERRRRNNESAKKSRDERKNREDALASRASFLEKANSVLKVKVFTMREEAMKMREMWVAKCQGMAINRHIHQNQQQQQNNLQNSVQGQTHNSLGQHGRLS